MSDACNTLNKHPLRDPKTGKLLHRSDPILKDLRSKCKDGLQTTEDTITSDVCEAWLSEPDINPITNEPVPTEEQKRTFAKVCGLPAEQIPIPDFSQDAKCQILFSSANEISQLNADCNLINVNDVTYWENVHDWILAQKRYIRNLTPEDRELIKKYESTSMFEWSEIVLGKKRLCNYSKGDAFDFAENLARFEQLILRAPRSPNLWVCRGERVDLNKNYLAQSTLVRKMFTSCTLDKTQSQSYSTLKFDPISGMTKISGEEMVQSAQSAIFIPAGFPCLFVSLHTYSLGDLDVLDKRLEVVLLPCTLRLLGTVNFNNEFVANPPKQITAHPKYYVYQLQSVQPIEPLPGWVSPSDKQLYELWGVTFKRLFKDNKDPNWTWVVKGGVGINLYLETHFNRVNLSPSFDLDVACIYNSNTVTMSDVFNMNIMIEQYIEEFIEKASNRYNIPKNRFYTYHNDIPDKNLRIYFIKYDICGNSNNVGLVDLSVQGIPGGFPKDYLDEVGLKKTGLPIKSGEGYLAELQYLLTKAIIKEEGDTFTYMDRNPIVGKRKAKGVKAMERAKLVCDMDSDASQAQTIRGMCNFLRNHSMHQLTNMKEGDLDKQFKIALAEKVKVEQQQKDYLTEVQYILKEAIKGSYVNALTPEILYYVYKNGEKLKTDELMTFLTIILLPSTMAKFEEMQSFEYISTSKYIWTIVHQIELQYDLFNAAKDKAIFDVWNKVKSWDNEFGYKPTDEIVSNILFTLEGSSQGIKNSLVKFVEALQTINIGDHQRLILRFVDFCNNLLQEGKDVTLDLLINFIGKEKFLQIVEEFKSQDEGYEKLINFVKRIKKVKAPSEFYMVELMLVQYHLPNKVDKLAEMLDDELKRLPVNYLRVDTLYQDLKECLESMIDTNELAQDVLEKAELYLNPFFVEPKQDEKQLDDMPPLEPVDDAQFQFDWDNLDQPRIAPVQAQNPAFQDVDLEEFDLWE